MHKNTVENYKQENDECIEANRNTYDIKGIVERCDLEEGDDCSSYINDIRNINNAKVKKGECNYGFGTGKEYSKNHCMIKYDNGYDHDGDYKIVRACKLKNGDDCSIYSENLGYNYGTVKDRKCSYGGNDDLNTPMYSVGFPKN
jgi:hypothetical protein